jgi:hypothetical protein
VGGTDGSGRAPEEGHVLRGRGCAGHAAYALRRAAVTCGGGVEVGEAGVVAGPPEVGARNGWRDCAAIFCHEGLPSSASPALR